MRPLAPDASDGWGGARPKILSGESPLKVLLVFFTAALTLAGAAVIFGALLSAAPSAGGVGVVVGPREKFLIGLAAALSIVFLALLAAYRRRGRRHK